MTAGRRRNRWPAYGLLTLAAVVSLFPLLWTLESSFKTEIQVEAYPPQLVHFTPTLDNYREIFTSGLIHCLIVSCIVTLGTVALTIVISAPCAYAIVRLKPYGRTALVLMLVLIQVMPEIVLVIPLFSVVTAVHLYDTSIALILVFTALTLPFATWILAAFFRGIPREIEEAAFVDGASRLKTLWYVVLPLTRPALATVALFSAIGAWNEFLVPVVLSQQRARPLSVFVAQFITQQKILWGPLTASMVVLLLPIAVTAIVLQRYFVAGLTAGSLK